MFGFFRQHQMAVNTRRQALAPELLNALEHAEQERIPLFNEVENISIANSVAIALKLQNVDPEEIVLTVISFSFTQVLLHAGIPNDEFQAKVQEWLEEGLNAQEINNRLLQLFAKQSVTHHVSGFAMEVAVTAVKTIFAAEPGVMELPPEMRESMRLLSSLAEMIAIEKMDLAEQNANENNVNLLL